MPSDKRRARARAGAGDAVAGVIGTARGRILTAVCGTSQTAAEIAARVRTSSNAVRVHLEALRKSGLVRFEVQRRGVGKPRHVYSLTPAAEYLLSRAYVPVLGAVIDTLRAQVGRRSRTILREAGAAMASAGGTTATSEADGISRGLELLRDLGGSPWADADGDEAVLHAACCPLGGVTRQASDVCAILEGALSTVTGATARERCSRGEHPECAFVISLPTTGRRRASRRAR